MSHVPKSRIESDAPFPIRYSLQSLFRETQLTTFLSEFLGNSGHFLIVTGLADVVLDGWRVFFTDPAELFLIIALVTQTLYLSRPQASRLFGNLIGVSLYTIVDLPAEGWAFFHTPAHGVFWIFSLAIALLQSIRYHWQPNLEAWVMPLESVVRMAMVLVFYIVLHLAEESQQYVSIASLRDFSLSKTHFFLSIALILVGLLLGFQQLQISKQQKQLQKTALLLGNLAEWGMGKYAVSKVVDNPGGFAFQKCDRAMLFMDIRGFTVWCEQTETETVAHTLNSYYQQMEPIAAHYHPLRITFTGDEVMAIYATPQQAVAAAQALQKAALQVLRPHHLGAGCAVHYGPVVEGLFGGDNVRTYTVIGDAVNTAKRLEGSTPAEEIMISDTVYQLLDQQIAVKASKQLTLKGKAEPFVGWLLA